MYLLLIAWGKIYKYQSIEWFWRINNNQLGSRLEEFA